MAFGLFGILYAALKRTFDHEGFEFAGYLSFILILSIFPFLFFLVSIAGEFAGIIGDTDFGNKIIKSILSNIPNELISGLKPRIDEIISGPPPSLLTIAIVGAIWTASVAVEGLRTVLNKAHEVVSPPSYILRRLLSVIQFIFIVLLVLVVASLLAFFPVLLNMLQNFLDNYWQDAEIYLQYINDFINFIIVLLGVSVLYIMLPNSRQSWRGVMPGSFLVSLLGLVVKYVLVLYISNFHQLSVIYGGLAGIVISMMFFYLLSLCFIYGGEFNYLFSLHRKSVRRDSINHSVNMGNHDHIQDMHEDMSN